MLALILFQIFLSSFYPSGVGAAANILSGSEFGILEINASFDYTVVGGGTAGLLMAARLTEQQSGRAAVVETGIFYELGNGNNSKLPFDASVYTSKARDDWQPLIDLGPTTDPQTVSEMNEANFQQRNWQKVFYGANYPKLKNIKRERDPLGVLYAQTAVGSDDWAEDASGRLCKLYSL